MTHCLIKDGVVVNIVVPPDPEHESQIKLRVPEYAGWQPPEGMTLVESPTDVWIGWLYDGTVFTPPEGWQS